MDWFPGDHAHPRPAPKLSDWRSLSHALFHDLTPALKSPPEFKIPAHPVRQTHHSGRDCSRTPRRSCEAWKG